MSVFREVFAVWWTVRMINQKGEPNQMIDRLTRCRLQCSLDPTDRPFSSRQIPFLVSNNAGVKIRPLAYSFSFKTVFNSFLR